MTDFLPSTSTNSFLRFMDLSAMRDSESHKQMVDAENAPMRSSILRNERLLQAQSQREISQHLSGIVKRLDMQQAAEAYDEEYLMSLDIPYSALSELCAGFLGIARKMKYKSVPQIWTDMAEGRFDWEREENSLRYIDSFR